MPDIEHHCVLLGISKGFIPRWQSFGVELDLPISWKLLQQNYPVLATEPFENAAVRSPTLEFLIPVGA